MRRSVLALIMVAALGGCTDADSKPQPQPQPLRARAAHTATLLPDGRVLLAGGCADDGCPTAQAEPSSEFYQSGRGFSAGPAMAHPRDGHSATLLSDGRVLMVGGFTAENTAPLSDAEVFDPRANEFRAAGRLAIGRGAHAAVRLPDGRVLIAGGWIRSRTYTASVEIFDGDGFRPGPSLPRPVAGPGAILLRDGRVLVAGGQDGPEHGVADAMVFLPDANRWQPVASMITPRFKHAMAMLPDGRVLVVGGTTDDTRRLASTEIFDPATNRFTPGPDMAVERYKIPDPAVTPDGRVVVAGGTRIEALDPVRVEFRTVQGTPGGVRSFPSLTALPDGTVLLVGGYDDRIRTYHDAMVVHPA